MSQELEALWRPDPAFIGPVGPPMVLWLRDREKQRVWCLRHGLSAPPSQGGAKAPSS